MAANAKNEMVWGRPCQRATPLTVPQDLTESTMLTLPRVPKLTSIFIVSTLPSLRKKHHFGYFLQMLSNQEIISLS